MRRLLILCPFSRPTSEELAWDHSPCRQPRATSYQAASSCPPLLHSTPHLYRHYATVPNPLPVFAPNIRRTCLRPIVRDQLASHFIVSASAPQYTPLALPLSSGTYFSGHSTETHPENCPANWKVFLITIILPAHSRFFPHHAHSITNGPQSTLLRQHLAHALASCTSTLPTKHQTNALRMPRNK